MLEPFEVLFDAPLTQASLPEELRAIYGGDWSIVTPSERPYIYSNFVISRDGRVSFNEPGHLGGGDVSAFNRHDRWLMALLRARADAVVMGDMTLKLEPEHLWTSAYIYPEDSSLFGHLRELEKRKPYPVQVFLSYEGDLDAAIPVFQQGGFHIIVATTARGFERASTLQGQAKLDVINLGEHSVDLNKLAKLLHHDYAVQTLLCEGGPRAYGGFIAEDLIDDEFLTLSPVVIGQGEARRPGLVEGQAFMPERHPLSEPLSLRRAGSHLFLRSRYRYPWQK